jgi:hypothetical protein
MKGTPSHMPAWVHIKRRKRNSHGQHYWEVVKAKGHMDEVHALTKAAGASCTSMTVSSCTSRGPSVMLNIVLVHVASSLAKLFTSTSGSRDVVCQTFVLRRRCARCQHQALLGRRQSSGRRRILAGVKGRGGVQPAGVRDEADAQGDRAPVPRPCLLRAAHHSQHGTPILHQAGAPA